jgi:hypothetical protein
MNIINHQSDFWGSHKLKFGGLGKHYCESHLKKKLYRTIGSTWTVYRDKASVSSSTHSSGPTDSTTRYKSPDNVGSEQIIIDVFIYLDNF